MEIAQKIRYRFSIKPGWDASWRRDDFTLWRDSYLPVYYGDISTYVDNLKRITSTERFGESRIIYLWRESDSTEINHISDCVNFFNIDESAKIFDILKVNFPESYIEQYNTWTGFLSTIFSYSENTICNDYGENGYEIIRIPNDRFKFGTLYCFDNSNNLLETKNVSFGDNGISHYGCSVYNEAGNGNQNQLFLNCYIYDGTNLYLTVYNEALLLNNSTNKVKLRLSRVITFSNLLYKKIEATNDSHILRNYFPFPEQDKYILRVINGTGTGNYAENETAVITANAQSGKTFLRWSFSPYAPTFVTGNEYTAGCSFKMPATNLVCTAEYSGQPTPSGGGDPYIPNPYNPPGSGGPSDSLPSDGTYDFTSVDIPIPNIPSITYSNTGFISAYKPTTSDLQNLSSYLWSDAFNIDNLKKLILNPYEAIYGLSIVPTYNNYPLSSPSTVAIGNLSTGLSMQKITSQYYSLDCGSVNIDAKWGNYFDYSPYNKIQLYLPYVGFVDLTADDCVRGPVSVTYHVDVLGGICVAYVKCGEHVLYTYAGQCSTPCPISQGQYQNIFISALKAGGAIAGAAISPSFGSVSGAVGSVADAAVSTIKPEISRGGSFGGSGGLMSIQYPYIVRTVPRLCIPANQNTYIGYPSFVSLPLSTLSGYTRIHEIHLHDIGATTPELNEIENLLKAGVIL